MRKGSATQARCFFGGKNGMLQCGILLAVAALVGLDQWTKWLASAYWRQPVKLWDGVFELTYLENRGAAWGIGQGGRWFFVAATSVVTLVVLWLLLSGKARKSRFLTASGILIAAGGIGNLIDRALNGYVVDFLYVKLIDFPVFNIADCCVVIGAILFLVYMLFIYKEPANPPVKEAADGADGADGDGESGGAEDRSGAAAAARGDAGDGAEVVRDTEGDGRGSSAE